MKCLVVKAHPLAESLCSLLTEHVVGRLFSMGHQVVLEDLYGEEFDPVLKAVERKSYYSDLYDYSGVSEQVKRLQEAEALVLLFPTWWFGFPAILKGWFDRVWGPGIAYDHASDFGPIRPRLDNLRKVLVVTSLGAPWWVDRFIMRQPVKRIMNKALLTACAKNSRLKYLSLYNSEKLSEGSIVKFKDRINKALNDWGE